MDTALKAFAAQRKASPNGPGHYHVADIYPYRVSVSIDGVQVAYSTQAIILKEVGKSVYDPTFYFPKEDVNPNHVHPRTDLHTHCPIKGEASYWDFACDTGTREKAAWSYESPIDYSEMIEGHLAFDQRFAKIEIFPTDV